MRAGSTHGAPLDACMRSRCYLRCAYTPMGARLQFCRTKIGQGAFKPVAGLRPMDQPGIEDVDFTSIVSSHSDWTKNMSRVLTALQLSGSR
jgi:hypothetical protein